MSAKSPTFEIFSNFLSVLRPELGCESPSQLFLPDLNAYNLLNNFRFLAILRCIVVVLGRITQSAKRGEANISAKIFEIIVHSAQNQCAN